MFAEWSPRTRARYKAAMTFLADLGMKESKEVVRLATRPNGCVNVSRMFEMAIREVSRAPRDTLKHGARRDSRLRSESGSNVSRSQSSRCCSGCGDDIGRDGDISPLLRPPAGMG
jgi:hypothetical protein